MPHQLRAYKASVFQALAHPTRIAIVEILRDGELSAGAMQARLGIEQANLSWRLTILRSRQIVVNRKGGNQVLRYRVNWRRQFMSSQLLSPNREAHIWARLMQAQRDDPSQEVARYLLSIGFGERDGDRMQHLADRSESGTLTDEERAEFDCYLHVGNLLAVMQSKARVALRRKPPVDLIREPGPG